MTDSSEEPMTYQSVVNRTVVAIFPRELVKNVVDPRVKNALDIN